MVLEPPGGSWELLESPGGSWGLLGPPGASYEFLWVPMQTRIVTAVPDTGPDADPHSHSGFLWIPYGFLWIPMDSLVGSYGFL